MTSDSLFYVAVEITQQSSPPRVEYLKYSLSVLKVIAEKINHVEGLMNGTYVMGTEPAGVRTASGSNVVGRLSPAQVGVAPSPAESQAFGRSRLSLSAESLPFSQISASLPIRARYPQFGFAGGVATYKPDAGSVWHLLGGIEEHYRSYGYPVDHETPDDSRPLAVCFSATVVVSPSFDVSLDVIRQEGFVKYKSVGLRGRYFPAEFDFGPLRLFGSAGFQVGWYSISSVCQYHDQIGSRDSLGRYMMFVHVDIQGAERAFSSFLGTGVELGHTPEFTPAISIFARYLISPDIDISSSLGEGVIRTRGFSFGATITVYFH
jgi:hypothetical protein